VKDKLKRRSNKPIQTTCLNLLVLAGLFLKGTDINAVEVKWHGASCLTIEDDQTRLIIDPFVTRPSLWKVITNSALTSDGQLVKELFSGTKKETHVLITHTHYDHVLDLPEVAKIYPKANIYGPKNLKALADKFNIQKERINIIQGTQELKLGTFKVKTYPVEHSTLPLGISFARGVIDKNVANLGAFDYKSQESIALSFHHQEAAILLHPSAEGRNYKDFKELQGIDLLIVGLTSRDLSSLKEKVISKIEAKEVMAIHHDNFFRGYKEVLEKMPFYPTLNKFQNIKLPIKHNIQNRKKAL
jgi:L-ascorbate metabolism protein UlaG (beta-lactamase superfamily)